MLENGTVLFYRDNYHTIYVAMKEAGGEGGDKGEGGGKGEGGKGGGGRRGWNW